MSDRLTKLGLNFDELNKIRIVDPEVATKSNELKDECKDFMESEYIKFQSQYQYFSQHMNKILKFLLQCNVKFELHYVMSVILLMIMTGAFNCETISCQLCTGYLTGIQVMD